MIKETTDKFSYTLKGESKKTTYWEKIFRKHNKELIYREYVKYSYISKRKAKINYKHEQKS